MKECCRNCNSLGYNDGYICALNDVQDISRKGLLQIDDIETECCEMYEEDVSLNELARKSEMAKKENLRKIETNSAKLGIRIKNTDGTYRDLRDVLKDMSEVWNEGSN